MNTPFETGMTLTQPTGSSIYIGPLVQFLKFFSPFQKNFETNNASIESTNKELLDSYKILGVAPSWG